MEIKPGRIRRYEYRPATLKEWVQNYTVFVGKDEQPFPTYFRYLCEQHGKSIAIEIVLDYFPQKFQDSIEEMLEDFDL